MLLLTPDVGLAALHTIMTSLVEPYALTSLVAVVAVAWKVLLRGAQGSVPGFFAQMAAEVQRRQARASLLSSDRSASGEFGAGEWEDAHDNEQHGTDDTHVHSSTTAISKEVVQDTVLSVIRDILGADVEPDRPLMEAGLDSLGELLPLSWAVLRGADRARHGCMCVRVCVRIWFQEAG